MVFFQLTLDLSKGDDMAAISKIAKFDFYIYDPNWCPVGECSDFVRHPKLGLFSYQVWL